MTAPSDRQDSATPEDDSILGGEPIEELLVECMEDAGGDPESALARLCSDHPDKAEELRERWQLLQRAGLLQDSGSLPAAGPAIATADNDEERFGEFRLLRELGRGGMGVVYLAEQPALNRRVALKVIRPDYLDQPRARQRFRREVAAASGLDHPGVCTVYEAGDVDGTPYIAMRYLEGETLGQRLSQQRTQSASADSPTATPTSKSEIFAVVHLIEQVARALHAAHEAGLIHRDVKPGNIMITADEEPVLLDFGLARAEESSGDTMTMTGDFVGTPAYMSPEQISPKGRVLDRRTDVYSLGVTLFESLTLHLPFEAPTREELYRQILVGALPDGSQHNHSIPKDLQIVLGTALEREPMRRYRTADEFAEDLRRVRELEPIAARRPSAPERLWRWAQREPLRAALALLLVVGVIAVGGLGGYILATSQETREGGKTILAKKLDRELALGYSALITTDVEGARKHFAVAMRLDPQDMEAVMGMVFSLQKLGHLDQASALLDRQDPTIYAIRRLRTWVLYQQGRFKESKRLTDALPFPKTPQGLFVRGYIKLVNAEAMGGRELTNEVAYKILLNAVVTSPTARMHRHVTWTHSAIGTGDKDRIWRAANTLRALWPDDPVAMAMFANAYNHVDANKALEACEDFQRRWPEDQRILETIATAHWVLGHDEEAIRAHQAAIRRGKTISATYYRLVRLLIKAGRKDEGDRVLQEGLARFRNEPLQRVVFCQELRRRRRLTEARDLYQGALKVRPTLPSVHAGLADIFYELREFAKARRHAEIAVKQDDRNSAGWYVLGRLLGRAKDREGAIHAYRKTLEIDPSFVAAHNNIGNLLRRKGEQDAARVEYEAAVQIKPKYTRGYYNLGNVLWQLRDWERAEAAYRKTIELDEDFAQAWCNMARMIAPRGRAAEALPMIQRGHALGMALKRQGKSWGYLSQRWVEEVEGLARQQDQLLAILQQQKLATKAVEFRPLVKFAYHRHRYPDACRAIEAAFESKPKIAFERGRLPRYCLATAAAGAGTGWRVGEAIPDPAEARRLRRLALKILQEDHLYWRKVGIEHDLLTARKQAIAWLEGWLVDDHTARIRDKQHLAKLPAEEQRLFRAFWRSVNRAVLQMQDAVERKVPSKGGK